MQSAIRDLRREVPKKIRNLKCNSKTVGTNANNNYLFNREKL